MPIDKITKFTMYTDGLQVENATGRDQWYIADGEDWEMVAACLDSLLTRITR